MNPEVLKKLVGVALTDFYAVGFLDHDETPSRFRPQFRLVNLEFGEHLIELRCIEDTGTIEITPVDAISDAPHLDADMESGAISLAEVLLTEPEARNEVTAVRLWGPSFERSSVVC